MSKEITRVFVYGTLKVGGYFASRFDDFRISSTKAIFKGTLFDAGGYPALIEIGNDIIHGEVHEYMEPTIVLEKMDFIEGFDKDKEEKMNLYVRKKVMIDDEPEIHVYFFQQSVKHMKRIKNGIWKL